MKKFSFVLFIGLILLGQRQEGLAFDQIHAAWDEILKTYTQDGFVNYSALRASDENLKRTIAALKEISNDQYDRWSNEEKIAFWINAYNAFTVQTIVDHTPVTSIKKIPNVWGEKRFETLGKKWSLNQIEHDVLRKEFSEPRIHFALVCASLGCPPLRTEAYTAEKLDAQLDDQARRFFSDTSKARYEPGRDVLYLSPIFKWFSEDFEKTGGTVAFVKKYFPAEKVLGLSQKTKIQWLSYDWNLNELKA